MSRSNKLFYVFVSFFIAAHAVAQTHSLPAGWSLAGNDKGSDVDPIAVFGNAATATSISTSVLTVWTWNNALGQWNFFAPSLTPQALSTYAASNKYGVLSTIAKGEGFWVNASKAVTVDLAAVSSATGVTYSGILGGYTSIADKHLGSPATVNGVANYVAGGLTVTAGSQIMWHGVGPNDAPLTTLTFLSPDLLFLTASGGFGISCQVGVSCSGKGVTFDRTAGKITLKSAPIDNTALTATGSLSFTPF